jgi:hypothetical protein
MKRIVGHFEDFVDQHNATLIPRTYRQTLSITMALAASPPTATRK